MKTKEYTFYTDSELKLTGLPNVEIASKNIVLNNPKAAGYYEIGKSLKIYLTFKPIIMHRFFTKLLLGWKWVDDAS